MLKAVIFDIDGTLIDSVDLHARSWVDAFARFGVEVKFEDVRRHIEKVPTVSSRRSSRLGCRTTNKKRSRNSGLSRSREITLTRSSHFQTSRSFSGALRPKAARFYSHPRVRPTRSTSIKRLLGSLA